MPAKEAPLSWSRRDLLLFAILIAAAGVQALSLVLGRIPWNSDQGIVALMGRHIALGVGHPIFCYGSYYGGTLEPHLTALVFAALGITRTTYRLSLMFFLMILLAMVYVIGRRFLGRAEGLSAAAYLALPPFFFLLKGLTSDGAYDSLAILGAGITYCALRIEDAIAAGEPAWRHFALLGVTAGLAWWVHPLAAYFFLAVSLWFLIVRPSVWLRFRDYPIFLVSFLLGSLPWWIANAHNGWLSLKMDELTPLPRRVIALQFFEFFPKAVPVLLGGRSFYAARETFPGASVLAVLLYAAPLVFAAIWIGRTGIRTGTASPKEVRRSRALLLLLILLFSMQFVVSFSHRIFQSDPRFLLPIYVPFSLLFGSWIVSMARARWRPLALAFGIAVVVFHGVGLARTEGQEEAWQPTTGSVLPLIRALDERGLRDVYTGYWTAYRLAFESQERIRPGIFGIEATDRYPRYTAEVDRAPSPAVILREPEASQFRDYLARVGSRARSVPVGPHVLFWDLEQPVIQEIRRVRRVPSVG
jgi:4-amino-4-deoxy-L-arabinose transferase-like glycosyltransferase